MPTALTARETYLKFVQALAEGEWAKAKNLVATDFRGTISEMPGDQKLGIDGYVEEMQRLRTAYKHFGRVHGDLHFSEKNGVLTVIYELDMVFVNDLQPRRGDHVSQPLRANNKPVRIKTVDTVTFNGNGKILSLVSASDAAKTWKQMNA